MRDKLLALRWARKIMGSKSFVVLTDTESFIAMDGIDPNKLNDLLVLQAQHASVEAFQEDLEKLKLVHEQRVNELGGKVGITREKSSVKTTGKKVSVRVQATKGKGKASK